MIKSLLQYLTNDTRFNLANRFICKQITSWIISWIRRMVLNDL